MNATKIFTCLALTIASTALLAETPVVKVDLSLAAKNIVEIAAENKAVIEAPYVSEASGYYGVNEIPLRASNAWPTIASAYRSDKLCQLFGYAGEAWGVEPVMVRANRKTKVYAELLTVGDEVVTVVELKSSETNKPSLFKSITCRIE